MRRLSMEAEVNVLRSTLDMQAREEQPIRTTLQLANLLGGPARRPSSKNRRPGSRTIHPATRVFQVDPASSLYPGSKNTGELPVHH